MSVIIHGLDMPLGKTELIVFPSGVVQVYDSRENYLGKAQAVPLPEGHVELKDSTEIIGNIKETYCGACLCSPTSFNCQLCKITKVLEIIENAPTIVPAEGGTDDDGNA